MPNPCHAASAPLRLPPVRTRRAPAPVPVPVPVSRAAGHRQRGAGAAGFLLAQFQAIPEIGDTVAAHGWRFEVADRDGRRIDRIIASRLPAARRRQKV